MNIFAIQRLFPLVFIGLLLVVTNSSSAMLIDDFDALQQVTVFGPNGIAGGYINHAGILGFQRDIYAQVHSGSVITNMTVLSGTGPVSSSLSHAQDSIVTGFSRITWDGLDNNVLSLAPTGLGGIDLTDSAQADAFEILVEIDNLPIDLAFSVYTDAGNWSRGVLNLPGGIWPGGEALMRLPFASLAATSGSGADMTNVGAIDLAIDGSHGPANLQIGYVRTVPEPSTLLFLILLGIQVRAKHSLMIYVL